MDSSSSSSQVQPPEAQPSSPHLAPPPISPITPTWTASQRIPVPLAMPVPKLPVWPAVAHMLPAKPYHQAENLFEESTISLPERTSAPPPVPSSQSHMASWIPWRKASRLPTPPPRRIKRSFAILGARLVGKTAIATRVTLDTFEEIGPGPTISNVFKVNCKLDGVPHLFEVSDTYGVDAQFHLQPDHFCGYDGYLLVFDLTNQDSFTTIQAVHDKLMASFGTTAPEAHRDYRARPRVLVGNKVDLVNDDPKLRAVPVEQAEDYAAKICVPYVEVSARTGTLVHATFEEIARINFIKYFPPAPRPNTGRYNAHQNDGDISEGSCEGSSHSDGSHDVLCCNLGLDCKADLRCEGGPRSPLL
jgi:GTPase SAR1 family protein